MELTPRTSATPARRRRRMPAYAVLTVLVLLSGFVLVKALGSASTFFRNVDEAVAQKSTLGTKRFRLQGTVVPGSVQRSADGVAFDITFNGAEIPVNHVGDPPEMFKENEAVLLEGHFASEGSDTFDSNLMIIKHSEVYKEQQSDRIRQADEGGQVPVTTTTVP